MQSFSMSIFNLVLKDLLSYLLRTLNNIIILSLQSIPIDFHQLLRASLSGCQNTTYQFSHRGKYLMYRVSLVQGGESAIHGAIGTFI